MRLISQIVVLSLIIIASMFLPSAQARDTVSSYLSEAKRAEESGKFSVAIKWFRKALNDIKEQDLKTKVLFEMGDCYYALNNQIAAINLYEEALKDPKAEDYLLAHPKTYLNLANIYFNRGQYDKAAEIYLKLTKRYRHKAFVPFALVKAGDSLLNLKQYKRALRAYSKVVLLHKDSPEYWITRFRMADIGVSHPGLSVPDQIEYRDYRKPVDTYRDILRNAPDNMGKLKLLANLRIASVYLREKRFLNAISLTKSIMKHHMDPTITEYAKNLMIKAASQFVDILWKKQDYLKICKVYELIKREIPISQFHTNTTHKLAEALYRMEMYKDALNLYLLSPKKNIKKIASIYNQLARYKETINLLMPLKATPDPELTLILARALYKEERFKDVISLLTPKIKDISHPEAYYLLANSHDWLGNKEKAIYYYKILTKKDSEYRLNACLQLGNILFDLKKYKDALSYYTTAQALCKECPDADFIRLQIASCHYQMGNYKRSAAILKNVKGNGLVRWVSNMQLEIMQLENRYKELRWLIE